MAVELGQWLRAAETALPFIIAGITLALYTWGVVEITLKRLQKHTKRQIELRADPEIAARLVDTQAVLAMTQAELDQVRDRNIKQSVQLRAALVMVGKVTEILARGRVAGSHGVTDRD